MRVAQGMAVFTTVLAGVLMGAGPAYAHVSLVSSDPARGATVPAPPSEVTLTFSEPVSAELTTVKVSRSDGTALHRGEPRVDGKTVTQSVSAGAGPVTVVFRTVGIDGHAVQGQLGYVVAGGSPDGSSAGAAVAAPADAGTPPPAKTRTVTRSWVWLLVGLGGVVLLGALAYVLTVGRGRSSEGGPDSAGGAEDG